MLEWVSGMEGRGERRNREDDESGSIDCQATNGVVEQVEIIKHTLKHDPTHIKYPMSLNQSAEISGYSTFNESPNNTTRAILQLSARRSHTLQ